MIYEKSFNKLREIEEIQRILVFSLYLLIFCFSKLAASWNMNSACSDTPHERFVRSDSCRTGQARVTLLTDRYESSLDTALKLQVKRRSKQPIRPSGFESRVTWPCLIALSACHAPPYRSLLHGTDSVMHESSCRYYSNDCTQTNSEIVFKVRSRRGDIHFWHLLALTREQETNF